MCCFPPMCGLIPSVNIFSCMRWGLQSEASRVRLSNTFRHKNGFLCLGGNSPTFSSALYLYVLYGKPPKEKFLPHAMFGGGGGVFFI